MPAAARRGDPGVVHCSGFVISSGSPDVLINGRPAARVGDGSTTHLRPGSPCRPHTSSISSGSPNVFVNGKPIARAGDALSGCTKVAQGSPNVRVNG